MPQLLLFVPCQVAVIDNSTNGLSVVNIVESIGLIQLPGLSGGFYVASWWLKEPGEEDAKMIERVELRNSIDVLCAEIETPFVFAGHRGQRILNIVPQFTVSTPGIHEFRLFIRQDGQSGSGNPITVFPVLIQQLPRPLPQNLNSRVV
jgi:hypothetical protein